MLKDVGMTVPKTRETRAVYTGKTAINMDFNGVNRVRIHTVWTPFARCKSPRKSVVIP